MIEVRIAMRITMRIALIIEHENIANSPRKIVVRVLIFTRDD